MMQNYGSLSMDEYDAVERIGRERMMLARRAEGEMSMGQHVIDSRVLRGREHMLRMIWYRTVVVVAVVVEKYQFHCY